MSNPNTEVPPVSPSITVSQPSAANPATAGAVASANNVGGKGGGGGDMNSISSLSDLKNKAPTVYKAMMQGIAMNICDEMKRRQDHIKELAKEYNQA